MSFLDVPVKGAVSVCCQEPPDMTADTHDGQEEERIGNNLDHNGVCMLRCGGLFSSHGPFSERPYDSPCRQVDPTLSGQNYTISLCCAHYVCAVFNE